MIKDIITKCFKTYINSNLKGIGVMLNIEFDPHSQILSGKIALIGESRPLYFKIEGIKLKEQNNNYFITFGKIEIDKKWLEVIVNSQLHKFNEIKIGKQVFTVLKMVKGI